MPPVALRVRALLARAAFPCCSCQACMTQPSAAHNVCISWHITSPRAGEHRSACGGPPSAQHPPTMTLRLRPDESGQSPSFKSQATSFASQLPTWCWIGKGVFEAIATNSDVYCRCGSSRYQCSATRLWVRMRHVGERRGAYRIGGCGI